MRTHLGEAGVEVKPYGDALAFVGALGTSCGGKVRVCLDMPRVVDV